MLAVLVPSYGGGPRNVDGTGQAMTWDNSVPVVYHADKGMLGTLTNAQADALLADAYSRWAGIPQVDLTFSAGSDLPFDVDATGLPGSNPAHWAHYWRNSGDGLSPVIYDRDGSIVDDMFGIGARYVLLGAAGIDTPISLGGTITGASAIINGAFFDGVGLPASPPDAASMLALEATMVHEIGHALNFDHSLVNLDLSGDQNLANDVYIPSMSPLSLDNEEAAVSPNPDDAAAAIALYPSAGAPAATWSLSGSVSKDGTYFQGAQIIVRQTADPLMYVYEAISGARFFPCHVGGQCYPCTPSNPCSPGNPPERGEFSIAGMAPGSYTVCVEQLDRRISLENGTSIGPLPTPPTLPGPEECWNSGESGDPSTDDPDAATIATRSAGDVVSGIDILLDDLPGSDAFEPNGTLATAGDLPGLAAMMPRDTIGADLASGDLDFYKVSVVAGHTYEIDLDASEVGSTVDLVMGLYDGTGALIEVSDDGVDPDSGMHTPDPAVTYRATFTGLLRIGLSSYPDLDLNGIGGDTVGPYWLRVIHDADTDGDGVADRLDRYPSDPGDDVDGDGVPAASDNCPFVSNAGQANVDGDAHGDACDNDQPLYRKGESRESNTAGARFGHAVGPAGDVDNDGHDDFLIGAPDWSDPDGARGAFYLHLGTPSGLTGGVRGVITGNSAPGVYGFSVAPAGDITCDGFDDFYVGDPNDRWVDLWHGAPTSTLFDFERAYDGSAIDSSNVSFGSSVANAGDVNGDGAPDLLVGDPNHPAAGTGRGKAYVFLASPSPSCAAPDTTPDWAAITVPGQDGAFFGTSVAGAGNVDGDAYDDVLVGAPGYDNGESDEGRAFLYLGTATGPSLTPVWMVESDQAGAGLGNSVAGAGDVNNDGYADVVVGAPSYDVAGADRGRVLVYLGSASGLPATPSLTLDGEAAGDRFGSAVAGVGDVNGDGYDDVAVGAPNHDAGGTDRGKVYLYLGSASGLSGTASIELPGDQDGANFGYSVAGVGDLNTDGRADITVGAPGYEFPLTQTNEGRNYVFLGSDGGDRDGDGVGDLDDNCHTVYNPGQQDSDTGAGTDATCTNFDDNFSLYGADNTCGTADDQTGDGVGDACDSWPLVTSFTSVGHRSLSMAWGDYDNDLDLDVWLGGVSTGTTAPEKLLRNDGSGVFVEVTPGSMSGQWATGAFADYDDDGLLDLVAIDAAAGVRLLRNTGSSSFSSVTLPGGLASPRWVSWVDYNADGRLDIYLATTSGGRFLSNDGSSPFTLVTPSGGLDTAANTRAAWQDFDGDGDQDVFAGGNMCQLYRNLGAGAFSTVTTATPHFCSSVDWGDYDNDGDADLAAGWQIIRNDGGGATSLVPAFDTSQVTHSWADYDNDGDLDVLRGPIQRNDGNDVFRRADEDSTRSHFNSNHVVADYDLDGRLDDFLTSSLTTNVRCRIAHNQVDNGDHWLELDLQGTISNRSAIGARVAATTGGITRIREVTAGSVSGPLRVHFGLGTSRVVDRLEIRWPSGTRQILAGVEVDQRITVVEADGTAPSVTAALPTNGSVDVSLYTGILLLMNEPIDPSTADGRSVSLSRGGVKVAGAVRVSSDRLRITFDPDDPLMPDSDYTVQVTDDLTDQFGNAAVPFTAMFDTGSLPASAPLPATDVGTGQSGSTLGGQNQDDLSGFSAAALGDVNQDGIADLAIGAPNTDVASNVDAGMVTLVFGQTGLQSNSGTVLSISLLGEGPAQSAGTTVSSAGDMNEDGKEDFLVSAPFASPNGTASGKVYLVFGNAMLDESAPASFSLGNLASCAAPVFCGVVFEGEAVNDMAGSSLAAVGDINDDAHPDLLIGAKGASPGGRSGAGMVYVVYGPLSSPGVIPLSAVGASQPGLRMPGENPGDAAGASVSGWDQFAGDGMDDLIIGAPQADATDEFGNLLSDAGYVYAIHGGPFNLTPNPASPATVELARVASGMSAEVTGVVFIGTTAGGKVGASTTGEVDIDGDGQADIVMGADGEVWIIPGEDPKTQSGSSKLQSQPTLTPSGLIRSVGTNDAIQQFGATVFTPGADGAVGPITVASAGDVNGDGFEDLIMGAAQADLPGKVDAGKAYIVFGSPLFPSGEVLLSDVGTAIPGVVLVGAEAGDKLGSSVSGGFDLNADGFADVLVGAPFADSLPSSPPDAGETYIVSPLPAAEVLDLSVLHATSPPGAALLEWSRGHRAVSYNLYRGLASSLLAIGSVRTSATTPIACAYNGDSDLDMLPDATDTSAPPVGDAFYYLVTGRNLFGEGSLGPAEGAPLRINDAQCP